MGGHWGRFRSLPLVNSAAVSIGVYISFHSKVFILHESGIVEPCGRPVLRFLRTLYCFPRWLHSFTALPARHRVPFSARLLQRSLIRAFLVIVIQTGVCEGVAHCGFDLYFPDDCLFTCPLAISTTSLEKCLCPLPFLKIRLSFFVVIEFYEFLIYFWYQPLTGHIIGEYNPPFNRFSFHFVHGFLHCAAF